MAIYQGNHDWATGNAHTFQRLDTDAELTLIQGHLEYNECHPLVRVRAYGVTRQNFTLTPSIVGPVDLQIIT